MSWTNLLYFSCTILLWWLWMGSRSLGIRGRLSYLRHWYSLIHIILDLRIKGQTAIMLWGNHLRSYPSVLDAARGIWARICLIWKSLEGHLICRLQFLRRKIIVHGVCHGDRSKVWRSTIIRPAWFCRKIGLCNLIRLVIQESLRSSTHFKVLLLGSKVNKLFCVRPRSRSGHPLLSALRVIWSHSKLRMAKRVRHVSALELLINLLIRHHIKWVLILLKLCSLLLIVQFLLACIWIWSLLETFIFAVKDCLVLSCLRSRNGHQILPPNKFFRSTYLKEWITGSVSATKSVRCFSRDGCSLWTFILKCSSHSFVRI